MSKAFCCDRCGKLYQEQGKTVIITEAAVLNSYDLCPDCGKELSSWINNEVYFVGYKEAADEQQNNGDD